MCGFVALSGDLAGAPGLLEAGLRAIRHRGPDGEGLWRSADGRVAMAHARLAIIDLSNSGAQPMVSSDGRGTVSFNGELYNYRELARQVKAPRRSSSDTEVLLELLRQRGVAALQLLRGMFAFAYWDGDELLLARDRLGVKPLFYADTPKGIAAASEIGALLAMRVVPGDIDYRAVDDYLTYLYVPPPRSGIVGICELPPGHLLRWRPGSAPIVERYWSLPGEAGLHRVAERDVREALDDAVRSHLVSDVPVGVFLSGGLDSSSLVALAAKHHVGQLRTFTITFGREGGYLDERRFANDVARRFGTEHVEIPVNPDVAQILPQMVAHFGQPFGNPTAVLTYALSGETRRYVKVALAGDGGDEVLGGYPRYQGALAAARLRAMPARSRALLAALARAAPASHTRGAPVDRVRRFLASAELVPDEMYFRWSTYLDEERKAELVLDREARVGANGQTEPYAFLADIRRRYPDRSLPDAAPLIDLCSFLPFNVLAYGDRMSMAHSLEVRVPFCDHLLVEKMAPLPIDVKMPWGIQKGLFRWAMRRDLPFRVSTHRKMGFNPPISAWLRKRLAPLVEEYLGEAAVRARGFLSPRAVTRLRADFRAGHGENGHTIWALLVLEAWMRWLR